ncbi:hypothetical protein GGI07_001298 [Coemansia sp. Benny D115]|nr:hypothetical protein GGI07_001298 [Coemansia sp. Benny D115]
MPMAQSTDTSQKPEPEPLAMRAVVHKQPFAVFEPDGAGGTYVKGPDRHWQCDGVSMAVRVFIGEETTHWMQRNQRWWKRTADKLEGKGKSGGLRKVRRKIRRHGEPAEPAGEKAVVEGSDWSSDSEHSSSSNDSSSSSDSNSKDNGGDGRQDGVVASCSPEVLDTGSVAVSTKVDPVQSEPTDLTRGTLAMPALPASPTQARQGVLMQEHKAEKTRRRSSLSTIRAFFKRSDKDKAKGGDVRDQQVRRSLDETASERQSVDGGVAGECERTSTEIEERHAGAQRTVTWLEGEASAPEGVQGLPVLLSGPAAVRMETAALTALGDPYTEATCGMQRMGASEWVEMGIEVTVRAVQFFGSKSGRRAGRAAATVLLPPLGAPRLSVFSALDVSLALAWPALRGDGRANIAVFKMRTASEARRWFQCLRQLVSGAAQVPRQLAVHVPELGVKVLVHTRGQSVWDLRHAAARALLADGVVGPRLEEWLAAERSGTMRVGMALRRGGRLTWAGPSGAVDAQGVFVADEADDMAAGPSLATRTHVLEMRTLVHYPDDAPVDGQRMGEPPGVEGFVWMAGRRPVLAATHDGMLFLVPLRDATMNDAGATRAWVDSSAGLHVDGERLFHPAVQAAARQIARARFMVSLAAVAEIEATGGSDDSAFFLRAAHGERLELRADSAQSMQRWVVQLRRLREYWVHRALADMAQRSRACRLNYALQGRGRAHSAWRDERALADRAVWHACLQLGCRSVVLSGVLFRKRRHRHQGMRRVFCVLVRGHLVEFECGVPPDEALAQAVRLQDALMARVAGGEGGAGDGADAGLCVRRARVVALRRCYVLSRRADDLTTSDIMCEPWVMTDIGNYRGLRLADRLYADGTVAHDLIDDCIFTLWHPAARGDHPAALDGDEGARTTTVDSSDARHDARLSGDLRPHARSAAARGAARRRLGVYKARSSSEMELWVTALNQEIRRMVDEGAW